MPRPPNSSPQTVAVLASLLEQPADWLYGYPLSKRTGLAPGTLYPILARLVEQGLLETRWEASETPGRPARHLYRLTTDGCELATARVAARAAARSATAGPTTDRPATARPTMAGSAVVGSAIGNARAMRLRGAS